VLARAIIRDVYGADDAARVIATLVMVMVVLPMLSPALGGELSARFGWRSVFIVVACLSSVVLLLSQSLLSETLRERQQFSGIRPFLRSFSSLMHSPAFRGYSLCVAFVSVVFFSFIAGAPEIMISTFERPPTEYGYYFVIVTTGFILGNEVARRFGKKFGVERMIRFGVSVSIFGILIAIGSQLIGIKHPLILFAPVALTIFGNGVTLPNAQASAINEFPQLAGTASGLTGFLQMAFSALFAQLVSIVFNGTAYPLLFIMLFASIASLYFFTTSIKQAVATKPKAAA
jgi:DHA1 family bicyclomycin/chloramphenicol resistance-like MFS transporter